MEAPFRNLQGTRRVLLTGASGLVGTAAAASLSEAGFSLRCLRHRTAVQSEGAEVLEGPLEDPGALRRALEGVEGVCHVAGLMQGGEEELWRVNVEGSRLLFEMAAVRGVERVVFVSTTAVYSPGEMIDVDEEHPTAADDAYGRSKVEAERVGRELLGERLTVLRPVTVYRTGSCPVIDGVAYLLLHGAPFPDPGKRAMPFDLVHAEDLARGIVLAMEGRGAAGTFHLAGPAQPDFRSVIDGLGAKLGVAPCWAPIDGGAEFVPFLLQAATQRRTVSIERARRQLGYEPACVWEDILARMPSS